MVLVLLVVWERCSKWHHDAWERAWLIKLFSGPLLASLGRADPGVLGAHAG